MSSPDDRLVCFCHAVRHSEIVAAIRGGAVTHAEIQKATRASTGCGGCECEVLEILQQELEAQNAEKAENVTGSTSADPEKVKG